MEQEQTTAQDFSEIIEKVCARDTSADPEHWSSKNPLWGHCAVVALIAQDLFGGTLIRQSLGGVSGFEYLRSHYSNKLGDGLEADFTFKQFGGKLPENLPREGRARERVLSYPNTQERYILLKDRVEAELLLLQGVKIKR